MKRGISFAALAIAIAVLTIFAAAIVFNTDYVFVNTEISKLQIDISQIEALMSIYKIRNNGNIDFSTVQLNTSNLSEAELEQFGGENIIDNNIQLYIIDLEAIDAESSNYGNLKLGSKDRYLYSLNTGKVYYEQGIEDDGTIYYYVKNGEE